MAQFFKAGKTRQSKRQAKKSAPAVLLPSLLVETYTDDGRGLARLKTNHYPADLQGKTVFISGALAGEKVSARVTDVHSRFIDAQSVDIESVSPERVNAECVHYGECGACHTQHMSLAEQHRFKHEAVLRQLGEWSQISPERLAPLISADPYHYRRRVKLAVDSRKQTLLGFRKYNSRQLIAINECPVMVPELEKMIEPLKNWLNESQAHIGHIDMVQASNAIVIVLRYLSPVNGNLRQQLLNSLQQKNSAVYCFFQGSKQGRLEAVKGSNTVLSADTTEARFSYSLNLSQCDTAFSIGFRPHDFIQANERVNEMMVEQAIDWLRPEPHEHMWDLFCGVGNFSIPLAALSKSVQAYEGLEDMLSIAEENARENACHNIKFIQRDLFDCDQLTRSDMLDAQCDGLILDPPRSGAKQVCEEMRKWLPKRIVYISCNSATFTRDAQSLCKQGYRLSRLGLIDMFPQTAHSEIMALFVHSSWHNAE